MDWIKKNPAQFGLAATSLVVIGLSAWLYTNVSAFPSLTTPSAPTDRKEFKKADLTVAETAQAGAAKSVAWEVNPKGEGSLFVARKYIVRSGNIVEIGGDTEGGPPLHPPVLNSWILRYSPPLDITDPNVLSGDPDADGFSNLDEYAGLDSLSHTDMQGQKVPGAADDSTDPTDPKSHPGYLTKLKLVEVKAVQFRLRFMAIDVDPKQPKNKALMQFQVNPIDAGSRSQYKKIGEMIDGTKYKLVDFEAKVTKGADGDEKDESILKVQNTEYPNDKPVDLALGKETDSPESYFVFHFIWVKPGGLPTPKFAVKKNGEFTLPAEPDKKYRIVEFAPTHVVLQLQPDGQKTKIPLTK